MSGPNLEIGDEWEPLWCSTKDESATEFSAEPAYPKASEQDKIL